jgi:outer membrane protein
MRDFACFLHNATRCVLLVALCSPGSVFSETQTQASVPPECISITGVPYFDLLALYNLALQGDTELKAAHAERESVRQIMVEKQALLLPLVQASASRFQNTTTDPLSVRHYTGQGIGLTLSQPLINFSSWADAQYGRQQNTQAKLKYLSIQQNLILRVVDGYFALLKAMDNYEAIISEQTAVKRHLEEATQRYKAGIIAVTDVEVAKARRDSAVAAEIDAKNELENQREVLQQIVNYPVEHIYRLRESFDLTPPIPADRMQWVRQALSDNFDLQVARFSAGLARQTLKSSAAQHLPTLNLNATLSKTTQLSNDGARPVLERPRTSNVNLTLSIPIFAGFGTEAQVKEKKFLYQKSFFELEFKHRKTELLTNQHYRGVLTFISRAQALKQASTSNEVALKATNAAFGVGTRTIVDVLDAQSNLIKAQKEYLASRYDYLLEGLRLKSMAGILDTNDLIALNALLAEEKPQQKKYKKTYNPREN